MGSVQFILLNPNGDQFLKAEIYDIKLIHKQTSLYSNSQLIIGDVRIGSPALKLLNKTGASHLFVCELSSMS
jgi:hypothetical protein